MINWKTQAFFIGFIIISFSMGAGLVKELILPAEVESARQNGETIGWNNAVSTVDLCRTQK